MNMYMIEYVNMIILLWNYPSIINWSHSHYLYLLGTWTYTMAYTYYQYNIHLFLTEENVKYHYANVLRCHIIRTIFTSLHSYLSALSIYLLQKEYALPLLFMSLYTHIIINYFYYFKHDVPYIIWMKYVPHIIDTIIILGCLQSTTYFHIHFILGFICAGRILSDMFVYRKFLSEIFLCAETYYIVQSMVLL